MREIKFRALSDHGWKYIDLTGSTGWARDLLELIAKDEKCFHFKTPLEQFTGLKDRTGREVYEGDIVKWHVNSMDVLKTVIWGPIDWASGFALVGPREKPVSEHDSLYTRDLLNSRYTDLEVVGNVHESPELLKEPKA